MMQRRGTPPSPKRTSGAGARGVADARDSGNRRIWILNHYATPPNRPGLTRHYDFGAQFVDRGHDVTIFASGFSHATLRDEAPTSGRRMAIEDAAGVRFVWLRTLAYTSNSPRRVLNMLDYARRMLQVQHRFPKPDVVVGSSVHYAAAFAAYLISRLRRATFVFEVRDLWPQTLIDAGALRQRGIPARLLRVLERFLCRKATAVVCVLPGAEAYFTAQGVPPEKIVYVPNAPPARPRGATVLAEETLALLGQLNALRERGVRMAGYTGAHGRANGIETLIDAAEALRRRGVDDLALVLIGAGPTKPACVELARARGLDNVLFADPVPRADIPAVLDVLDVTICTLRPSLVHQYGISMNKIFSYLSSGRPALFVGVAANPIQAAGAGLSVPPDDPERVADALVQLASLSPGECRELGERGQRYVREHHDIERLAERFLSAVVPAT
ncbi:MAG: glycosyltransferase family 4 protein [Dactylosporangium sp.]|nr:glycosyltransferase family 4 protein [Dactylosporangium sp.]NNJ60663.1 glycosyltransferase family 4 protein [Dactylosporangium sp.]